LNEDGSILSTAINGVCLALLDAGIALNHMIASVACAITSDGQILLDPDEKDEKEASSIFVLAFNNAMNGVVMSKTIGMFKEEDYFSSLAIAKGGCIQVFEFLRSSIEERYKKKL